jgi:hypothetical protein
LQYYEDEKDVQFYLGKWYDPVVSKKTISVSNHFEKTIDDVFVTIPSGDIEMMDAWGDSTFDAVQDIHISKKSDTVYEIWDPKAHLEFSNSMKI